MANTLTAIIPKILARALPTLRANTVMPTLVDTQYSLSPLRIGKTVDIEVPQSQTAAAVTAAITVPANSAKTPAVVQVTLDQWYETHFELSDQEKTQINTQEQFVPPQVGEAIAALGNNVDAALLALYKDVYNFSGTAGTTPFSSTAAVWTTGARKWLNDNNAPFVNRSLVLDVDAEANATNLSAFQDLNQTEMLNDVIFEGKIGRKLGANWHLNQQVGTHTAGTLAAGTAIQLNAEMAAGENTIVFKDSGGDLTGTLTAGDLFSVAGDTQTYVVTTLATASSNLITVLFEPAAAQTNAASAVVTHIATHNPNLAFQRGAFALATAPFEPVDPQLGSVVTSMLDPVTNLVLRLEVNRQWKQERWTFDVLYGVKTLRPQLAARILG